MSVRWNRLSQSMRATSASAFFTRLGQHRGPCPRRTAHGRPLVRIRPPSALVPMWYTVAPDAVEALDLVPLFVSRRDSPSRPARCPAPRSRATPSCVSGSVGHGAEDVNDVALQARQHHFGLGIAETGVELDHLDAPCESSSARRKAPLRRDTPRRPSRRQRAA